MNDLAEVMDEPETEEVLEEQPEIQHEEGGEGGQSSLEERAARMGWKPKEEYKGKDEWVPAAEYIEKAEANAPFMKKALYAMERRYEKLEKTTEAIHAHTQRQIEAAEKAAYEKAMADIQAEMAEAVESGDVEAVNKALMKRDKVISRPKDDPNVAVVNEWKTKNTWFGSDPALTNAAAQYTDILAQQGKSVAEQLAGAEAYIRETFPHKFKDERVPRKAPLMNGSGNNVNTGAPKKGTYEALDQQSRAECDRFVRDIVSRTKKSEKEARAEWLKFATDDMFR